MRRGAWSTLTDMRAGDRRRAADLRAARHPAGARRPRRGDAGRRADLIVLSPGVSPAQPDVARGPRRRRPVIGELELASRWLRGRIVAITGTKGKSTTTTLTGRMLEAGGHRVLVGGNIGHALSAQVDGVDRRHDPRGRGEQLSARDDRDVPPVDRRAPELLADHLDRHAERRRVRGGEGAHLREPDAVRLGGRERGRPDGAGAGRLRAGAPRDVLDRGRARTRRSSSPAARSSRRIGGRRRSRWCRSRAIRLLGPPPGGRRPRGRRRRVDRRRGRRGDDARGRSVHRPGARARAGRRGRRRAVRQRLEGHQHRGRASRDRELRRRAGRRSSAAGSRGASSATCAPALEARHATVVAIGEAAPLVRRALEGRVRDQGRRPGHGRGRAHGVRRGASGRDRRSSRRPARASTCSTTTRSAGARSRRKWRSCGARWSDREERGVESRSAERVGAHPRATGIGASGGARAECREPVRGAGVPDATRGRRAVSSHQSGRGGEELTAGNAGCPGLRGRCLPPAAG